MKKEVQDWWKQALMDMKNAEKNLKIEAHYVSAFLSQQAVEKALKTLLIKRTNNFPKIHDLVELSRKVDAPSDIVKLCAKINPAYTATRYPDVARDFDIDEVKEVMKSAKEVLKWVKKEID